MIRTGRFLLRFSWPNWAVMLGFVAVLLLGSVLTGVPNGEENLFSSYFLSFPLFVAMLMMILSFSLCSIYLDVALSFGARRRDYFRGIQGILLLDTLIGCALAWSMALLPEVLDWGYNEAFYAAEMLRWAGWLYPLNIFGQAALGCVAGLAMARSKVWGTVLMIAAVLLSVGFLIVMVLGKLLSLPDWLWPAAAAVMAVMAAGSEIVLWRAIKRHVVR